MNQLLIPYPYVYHILVSNAEMWVKSKKPDTVIYWNNFKGEIQEYSAINIHQIINN